MSAQQFVPAPMALDVALDDQGRHVLRGTAANGEPVTVRVPCEGGCRFCADAGTDVPPSRWCASCNAWTHHHTDRHASHVVTEPRSVPEPSTVGSGCSSKDLPSVCIRCGTVIWTGGIHLNGRTECDMWEVPGV